MVCSSRRIVHTLLASLSVVLIVWLAVAGLHPSAAQPRDDPPLDLFVGLDTPVDLTALNLVASARARAVTVNFGRLGGQDRTEFSAQRRPTPGDRVRLNLFDDVTYIARLDRLVLNELGSFTWVGHLEGQSFGQVILVVKAGALSGSISSLQAAYRIRRLSVGVHLIEEIDQAKIPPDDADVIIPEAETALPGGFRPPVLPKAATTTTPVIDLMVVYTPGALALAGNVNEMENVIDRAVAEMSQALLNSQINAQVQLVHTALITYTEAISLNVDLNRLIDPDDGLMDEVHLWRNSYTADDVSLIVTEPGCGVAAAMTSPQLTFENYAFNVVKYECLRDFITLPHEVGHNMGGRHEWYDSQSVEPYPYAHGYVNVAAKWRTIMAIGQECSDLGVSCPKILHYSNPSLTYQGSPTGVPVGQPYPADMRLTFNQTAPVVAQFRLSGMPPSNTGPLMYAGYRIDDRLVSSPQNNNNEVAECGEQVELYVYLRNQNLSTATAITATLATNDPAVTWLDQDGSHPAIAAGGIEMNGDDFDFTLAADTPHGQRIPFELTFAGSVGGPWSANFELPVQCLTQKVYLPTLVR